MCQLMEVWDNLKAELWPLTTFFSLIGVTLAVLLIVYCRRAGFPPKETLREYALVGLSDEGGQRLGGPGDSGDSGQHIPSSASTANNPLHDYHDSRSVGYGSQGGGARAYGGGGDVELAELSIKPSSQVETETVTFSASAFSPSAFDLDTTDYYENRQMGQDQSQGLHQQYNNLSQALSTNCATPVSQRGSGVEGKEDASPEVLF